MADLESIIKQHGLRPEQEYNGDETELYWKEYLQTQTNAPDITVLCSVNAKAL